MYYIYYIRELLRNLGFSYQKARFVSDHLNEEKRHMWLRKTSPAIMQAAHGRLAASWGRSQLCPVGLAGLHLGGARAAIGVKTEGKRKGYRMFGLI